MTLTLNEDEAVVYNPHSHELRKSKLDNIKENPDYIEVEIPRWGQKVDVYLEIGPSDAKTHQLLATVNLNSLGFTMNIRRYLGRLKSIYVLDRLGASKANA
ncbi:MAG: hypothetical protein M1813_003696 [Trichoglossum hirsutum]|nr:MAG: hypothetical protein M1813_003696 [Trichoglossum hirsutum]